MASTMPATSTDLVASAAAVQRLQTSLTKGSLADLVQSRRRSLMLVDISGSMNDMTKTYERKIDALRTTVKAITETHPVPVAAFDTTTALLEGDQIPEPRGGTRVAQALNFAARQGANHVVMVTDGQPHDQYEALDAGRAFGGPVDVFYIGGHGDRGLSFAQELARVTGGTCNVTDLTAPKELSGKITLLLGDGSN